MNDRVTCPVCKGTGWQWFLIVADINGQPIEWHWNHYEPWQDIISKKCWLCPLVDNGENNV